MFKKSIAVLALAASLLVPTHAMASTSADLHEELCASRAELARQIMNTRQMGVDESLVSAQVSKDMQYLVKLAYNIPLLESEEQKIAMRIAMGKVEYEDCKAGK